MRKQLENESIIAIDCEFANGQFFHIITALIQISTKTHDFVVDSLVLYNYIHETFYEIFMNPNILKVVFGNADVLALQRHFSLNMFPIFDLQFAVKNQESCVTIPSMVEVVKEYLNFKLDKSFRNFNFQWRPLLQNAINYARHDSKYLLECYNVLVKRQVELFQPGIFYYTGHRDLMLASYHFPKSMSKDKCFEDG